MDLPSELAASKEERHETRAFERSGSEAGGGVRLLRRDPNPRKPRKKKRKKKAGRRNADRRVRNGPHIGAGAPQRGRSPVGVPPRRLLQRTNATAQLQPRASCEGST